MTMPAGKYYVGDLCYVLNDRWDEFCDVTIGGQRVFSGEMGFKDGTAFVSYTTKWGDGQYDDQYGRSYSVDAGLIGCISVEHIDDDLRVLAHEVGPRFGGHIVEFAGPFDTYEKDGKIHIGDIVIDTDPTFEEDYDYDEEENY